MVQLAQLTAPHGGHMESAAADAPLPLNTFPALGLVLLGQSLRGPVGCCCYVLVAKSSKEQVSPLHSIRHNPMVSGATTLLLSRKWYI